MLALVQDNLLKLSSRLKIPIIAMDPGPRKCGVASIAPCEIGGLYLNYTRQEPIRALYDEEKSKKVNARTMTDIDVAGIAANFVRQFTREFEGQCEVLLENQPPGRVTGKAGRTTRTLTLAMISGFTTNNWPVTLRTVKSYKEKSFGLIVHSGDHWSNKMVSKTFVGLLADRYPVILSKEELKSEPDICDALILLFSRLIELVSDLSICHLIEHPNPLQVLELGLVLVQYAHRIRQNDLQELGLETEIERITKNELYQQCYKQSIALPVDLRTAKSKSTKQKKVGTHGVPIASFLHHSHSIIPPPPRMN